MTYESTPCWSTYRLSHRLATGMLKSTLPSAAEHYETRCDETIDRLIPLLEPAMMVILSGLIAMLLLAMYLPLFQMGSVFG
jgi:type IV pilus assembly protein PilC